MRIIIAICAFALALDSLARAADVDWKTYGTDSFYGDVVCFYDVNGIIHTPAGHVRVRTKCLLQSVLDGIDKKSEIGRRIVKNTARKAVDNYVPPIAAIENIDFEETISVIQYEETADIGGIEPHARVLLRNQLLRAHDAKIERRYQDQRQGRFWQRAKCLGGSTGRERHDVAENLVFPVTIFRISPSSEPS